MTAVTVIGFGNPLREDDGLGPYLARRLAAAIDRGKGAEGQIELDVLTPHQLTPELAEPISRSRLVLFIDASRSLPPGQWSLVPVTPGPALTGPTTHHLDPSALLTLAALLSGPGPGQALFLTISGERFGYGQGLSPAAEKTASDLEDTVSALIRDKGQA